MLDEWRRSIVVSIYINNEDIQNRTNYRGIKLMSHTMKHWERVIEQRLRQKTKLFENQFGFMLGGPLWKLYSQLGNSWKTVELREQICIWYSFIYKNL